MRSVFTLVVLGHGCLFSGLALAVGAQAQSVYTTPYTFTTLAGLSSVGSNDGPAEKARFYGPAGVVVDSAGNLYVADEGNNTIRKITPAGTVLTLAGKAGLAGDRDGPGEEARFYNPRGLALDATGALYVTDTGNHVIRKIAADGIVSTLAGVAGAVGHVNGPGAAARFHDPADIALDKAGNLYVNDLGNRAIRKITPAGVVSTFTDSPPIDPRWAAGTGGYYHDRYVGVAFRINGLAVDAGGNVLVSDWGTVMTVSGSPASYKSIRKITTEGVFSTLLGGPGADPAPAGKLATTAAGTLVVAADYTLHEVASDQTVTLLAGALDSAGTGEFYADGPAAEARFMWPRDVTVAQTGDIFLTDNNNVVRQLSPTGIVSTLAGVPKPLAERTVDGAGGDARFHLPVGVALDAGGNVLVADLGDRVIRKITPAGVVTTLAGTTGPDDSPVLLTPEGVAADAAGNVYVTDLVKAVVFKITPDGTMAPFAGLPDVKGNADGSGEEARFNGPYGIAVDTAGNVYVTDIGNATIRKITPAGLVSTLAGVPGQPGSADGPAREARFHGPEGIAVDAAGNVYVSESGNHTVRKITPSGLVTTLAGSAGLAGDADGTGSAARFFMPNSLAVDAAGVLFVTETQNSTVRRITPDGVVSTLAGLADGPGSADGVGSAARFYYPHGVAVDADGNLYVTSSSTVRKGAPATVPVILTQPRSQTVAAGADAVFSVEAGGTPALTFQWYFREMAIAGATGPVLAITGVSAAHAGEYTVLVTNGAGSTGSDKALLAIAASPPPVVEPVSGTRGGGSSGVPFVTILAALGALRILAEMYTRRSAVV